jgi:tetratricopeptide (TPR) repeat protein
MKKRKPTKQQPNKGQGNKAPMSSPRSMDKVMSDLSKLLAQHEFSSIDEVNAFLQENVNGGAIPSFAPETPLEEAQELMYEAWETHSPKERIRLARKALKISPDCADAYVLLAEEEARSAEEARDLYAAGVAAGERALADDFEEMTGHFWGITATRPYMRARAGLATTLWLLGQHEAAVTHFKQMLYLNPGDNQGIRYTLLNALLSYGTAEEIEELLAMYPDDVAASWLYNRALFVFRQGSRQEADEQLAIALSFNEHVPAYLLKRRRLPGRLPDYIGLGDETEAASYVYESQYHWQNEPGALVWLQEAID